MTNEKMNKTAEPEFTISKEVADRCMKEWEEIVSLSKKGKTALRKAGYLQEK